MQIHVCTLLCLRIRPSLLTMCCLPGVELGRAWDEGLKFSEKEITQKGKLLFAPEMYSEKKKKVLCPEPRGHFAVLVRNSHPEHGTCAGWPPPAGLCFPAFSPSPAVRVVLCGGVRRISPASVMGCVCGSQAQGQVLTSLRRVCHWRQKFACTDFAGGCRVRCSKEPEGSSSLESFRMLLDLSPCCRDRLDNKWINTSLFV